jgi:CheY-like chemotaxis protein
MMDIHMPVMDGLSAVRLIRNIKELCEVSIVAFSAFSDAGNRQRALDAGCNDYVNKTAGINQLSNIVQRYLPAA